jgi:hypothetical protein
MEKRSKRINKKEMDSNSNSNKDSSEAHRVLVLQGGEHLVHMRQEYMMYCISRGYLVEYVATFPKVSTNSGDEYRTCLATVKDLELICKSGHVRSQFPCCQT